MPVIIGLGNPGEKYRNNRHNIGHMFIDYLKSQNSIRQSSVQANFKTYKTDCFMNLSGSFVKKIIKNLKLKIENLIIIHDDLDIPLGKFKIQKGTGPQLHNGIESVENALGTKDFWRIRIGVDNRKPDNWIDGETYVLQNFQPDEKKIVSMIFNNILQRLLTTPNFKLSL